MNQRDSIFYRTGEFLFRMLSPELSHIQVFFFLLYKYDYLHLVADKWTFSSANNFMILTNTQEIAIHMECVNASFI